MWVWESMANNSVSSIFSGMILSQEYRRPAPFFFLSTPSSGFMLHEAVFWRFGVELKA